MKIAFLILPITLIIISVGVQNNKRTGSLKLTYPADETVFPPEFPPPTVLWDDPDSTGPWLVELRSGMYSFSGKCSRQSWKPGAQDWEKLKANTGPGNYFTITVRNQANEYEQMVSCRFAPDSVGAKILFRDLPLPRSYAMENLNDIRWRIADPRKQEPGTVVLSGLKTCGNCHIFSSDGSAYGMDVDRPGDKGSYLVSTINECGEAVIKEENFISWTERYGYTFGLFTQLSPDGRYVLSSVKDEGIMVYLPDPQYSLLMFPTKGSLALYDRKNKSSKLLSGADDSNYVYTSACWSPDGEYLAFSRGNILDDPHNDEVRGSFVKEERPYKYDLCRIPFNDGKGGKTEVLLSSEETGESHYFARYSPDGKWIVFTKSKNYLMLQKDSKLCIMPAEGGKAREMRCNTREFNSWHSFSPNSRWLAFSTKACGPYTQIYMTYIDEQGKDYPPVYLENIMNEKRAANLPEFIPKSYARGFSIDLDCPEVESTAVEPELKGYIDSLIMNDISTEGVQYPTSSETKTKKQNTKEINLAESYYKQAMILNSYGRKEDACKMLRQALEHGHPKAADRIKELCP